MGQTPTLADLLKTALVRRMEELNCVKVGEVTEYDETERRASVQPLVSRPLADGTWQALPVVVNVPVVFVGGGGGALTFPIEPGDLVLLLFSDRSLDEWLSKGGQAEPRDPRTHDLSDGLAIPGLASFADVTAADADAVRLHHPDCDAKIYGGADKKVAIGNDQAELGDLVDQLLDALIIAKTLTMLGPQPLDQVATFTTIKADLAKIKGTL